MPSRFRHLHEVAAAGSGVTADRNGAGNTGLSENYALANDAFDEPSDIADTIAALCSGDTGWISGQTIFSNGAVV